MKRSFSIFKKSRGKENSSHPSTVILLSCLDWASRYTYILGGGRKKVLSYSFLHLKFCRTEFYPIEVMTKRTNRGDAQTNVNEMLHLDLDAFSVPGSLWVRCLHTFSLVGIRNLDWVSHHWHNWHFGPDTFLLWGFPVDLGMFSSIPCLYPVDASSNPTPTVTTGNVCKISPDIANVLWGRRQPTSESLMYLTSAHFYILANVSPPLRSLSWPLSVDYMSHDMFL